jgi:hypothetical protein
MAMRTHDCRRGTYYLEPLKNYEYVPAISLQSALPGFGGLGRPFSKKFFGYRDSMIYHAHISCSKNLL